MILTNSLVRIFLLQTLHVVLSGLPAALKKLDISSYSPTLYVGAGEAFTRFYAFFALGAFGGLDRASDTRKTIFFPLRCSGGSLSFQTIPDTRHGTNAYSKCATLMFQNLKSNCFFLN